MKKQTKIVPDEQIRKEILKYLYRVRNTARSLSSMAVPISKIKRELKKLGISQNQVVRNLDFLVQNGWVIEQIEKRIYKTPKGFEIPSEKKLYKLSDRGINYFEGPSQFTTTSRFSGININNVSGIVILGDNNIVRTEYVDLFKKLEQLENEVKLTNQLTTEQKLDIQADIQVIKDQLVKIQPNRNIIQRAMQSLSFLSSIPGIMELFEIIKTTIKKLFLS